MATTEEIYLGNLTDEELFKKLEEALSEAEAYNEKLERCEKLVRLIEHEMAKREIKKLNEQGNDRVTLIDFSKNNQKKSN